MPSIENWQEDPLSLVKNIFDNRKDSDWQNHVQDYFRSRLVDEKFWEIPSLNSIPLHELKPNSLVRFRAMIQDTFENEYYLDTFEVVNKANGDKSVVTSRFQDIVDQKDGFDIIFNSNRNKTEMRQVLYCVSVPGESSWTKKRWDAKQLPKKCDVPSTSFSAKKRELEEDDCDKEDQVMENDAQTFRKRKKQPFNASSNSKNVKFNKNHPLSGEDGPVCLVKVYDDDTEDYKVNQVLEFIGILSVDPLLSSTYDNSNNEIGEGDGQIKSAVEGMETDLIDEHRTHYPPASLVPRLHVVACKKMPHINPDLPYELSQESLTQSLENMAPTLRSNLLAVFQKATCGDAIAAEYLVAHLLARVYTRRDVFAVGSYPLNITGIQPNSAYPNLLSDFLSHFVTKLHYFAMTVDNLNSTKFIPTKNYETDKLDSGMLQLSSGTHLILDECAMKPGNLDTNGVKHIQALNRLMTGQTVDYNFKFHHVPFPSDVNILVLSEGKSLLSCDCQVVIKPPNGFPQNLEAHFADILNSLNDDMMYRFRIYLDTARLLDHEVPQDVVKTIEEDFVSARRENSENMTTADLHMHLILARLLSISSAKQTLCLDVWQNAKMLEAERKQRLPTPTANASSAQQAIPNGC